MISMDLVGFSLASLASFSVICLLFIFIVSLVIILPIYKNIYKKNHVRDCLVPVYPITEHFYKTVVFLAGFLTTGISVSIISYKFASNNTFATLFITFFIISAYFLTSIITIVQNFLIFAISLQRFLIYFFPSYSTIFSPTSRTFSRVIKWFYILIIAENIFIRGFKVSCFITVHYNVSNVTVNTDEYLECVESYDFYHMASYFTSDLLVFVAAILYLIIMRHVRKIRKSIEQPITTRPERYLLYQTLLIFLTRMLAFPLIVFLYISNVLTTDALFYILMMTDILTTPFMIQVSYLVCNKDQTKMFLWSELRNLSWLCECFSLCSPKESIPEIRLDGIDNEAHDISP